MQVKLKLFSWHIWWRTLSYLFALSSSQICFFHNFWTIKPTLVIWLIVFTLVWEILVQDLLRHTCIDKYVSRFVWNWWTKTINLVDDDNVIMMCRVIYLCHWLHPFILNKHGYNNYFYIYIYKKWNRQNYNS